MQPHDPPYPHFFSVACLASHFVIGVRLVSSPNCMVQSNDILSINDTTRILDCGRKGQTRSRHADLPLFYPDPAVLMLCSAVLCSARLVFLSLLRGFRRSRFQTSPLRSVEGDKGLPVNAEDSQHHLLTIVCFFLPVSLYPSLSFSLLLIRSISGRRGGIGRTSPAPSFRFVLRNHPTRTLPT